jgi:hypothetical protein
MIINEDVVARNGLITATHEDQLAFWRAYGLIL